MVPMSSFRPSAAATLLAAALFLPGCGKPPAAVRTATESTVAGESGPLPAAGTANRLKNEQSAYLRHHASDPVDWHPWGDEAFAKARAEGKLLLVSIGYASCPWSQKMQDECFTNAEVARFMNRHYVNVLVDREERPDLNNAFLHYLFWKQKQSGWPLHIWLTPDGLPVYAGVYFPRLSAGDNPGWSLTIEHVANSWANDPAYVERQARQVADRYLADYSRMWKGPNPAGSPQLRPVVEFLALPPAERVARFRDFDDDQLQHAVSELPAGVLDDLFAACDPAAVAGIIERLRPAAAGRLFPRVKDPALRDAVFRHYSRACTAGAFEKLRSLFDPVNGGFSQAPKFMQPHNLDFLMRTAVRESGARFGRGDAAVEMVATTLRGILQGGIHDHLAGGFHRYSTDSYWAVPQFEKMLYDQGLMAQVFVSAAQLTGDAAFSEAARRTLAYAISELSHPEGGFYSAEGSSSRASDAGEMAEGAYYFWNKEEIDRVAGAEAAPLVAAMFGIEERGNLPIDSPARSRLPRANLLIRQRTAAEAGAALGLDAAKADALWEGARGRLLDARRRRPRPTLEDKVLTSWNGTVISALARAGFHLDEAAFVQRAGRAAEFILTKLRRKDGGLIHAFLDGPSAAPGYAEDYAMFIGALTDLYETTGDSRWLKTALELQTQQIKELWDQEDAGFYDGPASPFIFQRIKSMDEATELAAGSASTLNLLRLAILTGNQDFVSRARRIMDRFGEQASMTPVAFVRFLQAAELAAEAPVRLVVAGRQDAADRSAMLAVLRRRCLPGCTIVHLDGSESAKGIAAAVPVLGGLPDPGSSTAVHLCEGDKVVASAATAAALEQALDTRFRSAKPAR